MIIFNEIVMKIYIVLKIRLRFVWENVSMVKSLIELLNFICDWNVLIFFIFGFLEEVMRKVISEF